MLVLLYLCVIVNFIIMGRNALRNHDKKRYEEEEDDEIEANGEEQLEYADKNRYG